MTDTMTPSDPATKARKPRKLRTLPRSLYFAYGANTNLAAMASRCPLAVPNGRMTLNDHRLVFRGVADVEQCKGRVTFGALWWITSRCERSLDAFEGFPDLYTKQYGRLTLDGVEQLVMFYTMTSPSYEAPPYTVYERTLREGYASFGLPTEQIDLAIEEGPATPHRFSIPSLWTSS